jgi:hypothetical protein
MRCTEGDLAAIVTSEAGNEGRRVLVDCPAPLGPHGPEWWVTPLQPLRLVCCVGGYTRPCGLTMERTTFADAWLRPIRAEPLALERETSIAREVSAGVAHG